MSFLRHDPKYYLVLGLGFEKLLPHMLPPLPPVLRQTPDLAGFFLQQIRRSTHASRLDLTVPSSPIKSEALREERVNRVWRAALSSQSVDVASQQPRSDFILLFFLQTCKNHLCRLVFITAQGQGLPPHAVTTPLSRWPAIVSVSMCSWLLPSAFDKCYTSTVVACINPENPSLCWAI